MEKPIDPSEVSEFVCPKCYQTFLVLFAYIQHARRVHNEVFAPLMQGGTDAVSRRTWDELESRRLRLDKDRSVALRRAIDVVQASKVFRWQWTKAPRLGSAWLIVRTCTER